MAQRRVFERGAHVRRRIARALVLLAGAGLVAWIGLVATAVVPNGGTVELPDFVAPLPARGGAPAGAANPRPPPPRFPPADLVSAPPLSPPPPTPPPQQGGGP